MSDDNSAGLQVKIETWAPFLAGLVLMVCGALAALQQIHPGFLPPGPMEGANLPICLIVIGAGMGIFLASLELHQLRQKNIAAQRMVQRARAERELALLQARRMRAQTDGLALMREIHRSTAIPERHDRLHRILTLLSDMFDAREVTLFAAGFGDPHPIRPVAYASSNSDEEVFVTFEEEAFDSAVSRIQPFEAVQARDTNMACEGSWLYCEGLLYVEDAQIARAQWRQTLASQENAPPRQNANEMLAMMLSRIDYTPASCRYVSRALEQRRTIRKVESDDFSGNVEDGLLLCVPLMADQRPIGVLRIRRQAEGFDGPIAEAFEETLIESAKHIALAMKKDEDDRKAITDQLTGLYIKRHFLVTLEMLRARAASGMSDQEKNFTLVLCDIDHFKQVNDSHGHLSGDLILKNVARVIRACLRTGDLAFRYGGEEMAILMPGASLNAAQQTAERLRAAIEKSSFRGEHDQPIPITISMGVARHQPGLPGQDLISRADRGLYASKHGGRNQVTIWSKDLQDPLKKTDSKHISKKQESSPLAAHTN